MFECRSAARGGGKLGPSVVERKGPTHDTPATTFPSHFTRNLKFLYGSKRCGLTGNSICDRGVLTLQAFLLFGR